MISKELQLPQQHVGQPVALRQQSEQPVTLMPLVALAAGICILSLSAIFTRLSEQELSASATIFNRFWIATVTLGLWSGVRTANDRFHNGSAATQKQLTWGDVALFVILAILVFGRAGSWAWSLTQTSVANSNLLHNMTPLFAALGGWLFLGHCFDKRFLIGMALAVGGALVIGIEDLQVGTNSVVGDTAALLSAVFYAANFLVIEQLRTKFSTVTVMVWSCLLTGLLTLGVVVICGDQLFPTTLSVWLAVICLGVLSQGLGQGLLTYCLKRFASGFVALFMLLEPLLTAFLAWALLAEQLSLVNWCGFFVVLAGLYLATTGEGAAKEVTE